MRRWSTSGGRKEIDMKHVLALAGLAAAALSLGACADEMYAGGGNWGGPVAYDGWYDGAYGDVYDGYWGDDGYFYYRHGSNDHKYYRGDRAHFARGDSAPGGNYHHIQGAIQSQPQGVRMPHFGGGGMHGGGDHQGH
jgi:hypothetical protein